MITANQALDIILEKVSLTPPEEIKLIDSLNRILAEDVYSDFDIPDFDNSAMDGYALRFEDTDKASGDNPKIFDVIDIVRAGVLPKANLTGNQAIKIMTGAMIPKGADSVVKIEDTKMIDPEGKKIQLSSQLSKGQNIRLAGENIKKGDLVATSGSKINSPLCGVLASLGKSRIKVFRKPKIAILVTGDEVIDIESEYSQGKLYNSNTYTLHSQTISLGAIPIDLGIVSDDYEQLKEKIQQGLEYDLLITSGGVSMGDYDLVKPAFKDLGALIKFHKIAIRPGKPVLFGFCKGKPFFGLPGNPVSSMVGFENFIKPLILKMMGFKGVETTKLVEATLEEDIKTKPGLKFFIRAQTTIKDNQFYTRTTGPQGSAILKSMLLANSFIIIDEDADLVKKGTKVIVKLLD